VATYRVYSVDKDGRASRSVVVLNCANDGEAIEKARSLAKDADLAIWNGPRWIATFKSGVLLKL
jgi:hypothetical protein